MESQMANGLKAQIATAREKVKQEQQYLRNLLAQCKCDNIVESDESAYCDTCGKHFGWYCPDSPSHFCQIDENSEYCIYCGNPEERK